MSSTEAASVLRQGAGRRTIIEEDWNMAVEILSDNTELADCLGIRTFAVMTSRSVGAGEWKPMAPTMSRVAQC